MTRNEFPIKPVFWEWHDLMCSKEVLYPDDLDYHGPCLLRIARIGVSHPKEKQEDQDLLETKNNEYFGVFEYLDFYKMEGRWRDLIHGNIITDNFEVSGVEFEVVSWCPIVRNFQGKCDYLFSENAYCE